MSDARPSVPPFDGEPVSSRGVNSRDFLARLSDASSAADFVPGRRAARAGSGPALQPLDVHQLAQEVASFAETEPSPAVRARALSTAGVLWSRAGSPVEGREALAAATQLSGKLASVAAELRAVADANDEATVDASLEAAARLAAQPASRHHAALLRALGSLAAGDEPRATALLDHVQRSGGTDPRIAMLRWLLRQAAGQTTVGLDLPPAFAEAAARVGELSSGRASEQAASYLELVRAARHLSRNETEAAAQALVRRPLLSSRPLAVELLASRPEHRQQAETLRRELLTTSPSTTSARLAWRAWLQARAAGGADTAPPSTESLVAAERALAAALLQASPAAEGLASASSSSGIDTAIDAELAAILAPPGDVAWPDSRHQAEVRLGATLTHSSESWSRAEGTERTSRIDEAGDEDGGEGSEGGSLTLALLAVEAASRRGRSDEVAERLDALAERTGRTEASALAALLREKHGVAPPDGAVWRELPQLGLLAVAQTHDAEQRLAALENEAERSSNAELSADLWLEAALRRDGSKRVDGLTRAARTYGEAGLWLATWAYQAGGGAPSQADDEARSALASSGDPWLERWARLDRAWAQGLEAGGALEQLVEEFPQDGLLRRAAEWLAGHAPTGERIPSRWQAAQRAAHAWFGGDDSAAFQELSNANAAEGLARTLLDELGETLGQTARESERLLEVLRGDDDPERLRAYTRLAALDRSRGDMASALLWQKTAVEEFPEDLGAVLDLEASILTEGRILEWPYVRERLARLLPPEERQAYVELGVVMALGALAEREARAKWESGRGDAPSSLVGLRLDYSQALATGDDARVAELSAQLAERASSDLDRAALLLEAAQAELRLGHEARAGSRLDEVLAVRADSFSARLLAAQLAEVGPADAEALEQLARSSAAPHHRTTAFLEAGRAWREANDDERAKTAFAAALDAEPTSRAAFHELSEVHLDSGDVRALAELLQLRLRVATDTKERFELELRLAQFLLELDEPGAARSALERALLLGPSDARALRAHAQLCTEAGDAHAAERSLVALRDVTDDRRERAAVLRTLGGLYDGELNSLEKAMDAYEGALAIQPNDRVVERALVGVFTRLGLGERATNLQTQLIQSAPTDDEKRREALRLAELYETVGRDEQRAGATLERALKAWPHDAEVFEQGAAFYERRGDTLARAALIERVKKDVERTLLQGRLDAALLDTFGRAARLAGLPAQAEAIAATRATVLGEPHELAGGGIRAFEPALDEWLAPKVLSAPLLRLLRRTGPVLDVSFPVDLNGLGASRLEGGPTWERLTGLCRELGKPAPEIFVSEQLGFRCQAVTAQPPRFVVGRGLDELPPAARDYQLARALAFQQLGVSALTRSRPEDAWSMVAALLVLFAPNWRPKSGDARKVAQARALVEQGLARIGYDDDVPTLALETIGALGDQGEALSEAYRTLGMRIALTFVGSPRHAIAALSASSDRPLPESGPSRFRWFESHPEAKDLLHFALADEFARGREALGLAAARTHRAPLPPRAASLGPVPPRRS